VQPLYSRLSAISLATLLLAATAANAERTYKWVDAEGNTHYGDHVPLQESAQQRQEINEQGRTLKTFDKSPTADEIAEQKRLTMIENEKQKQSKEQARLDSELLATYPSESDLLFARDNAVNAIKEFIHMTTMRIDSLQKRQTELAAEAADYEGRGKPVPEFVQHQAANVLEQIDQNQATLILKQAELGETNQSYAAQIERYHELQLRNPPAR
jgi:nicotinamide mononucleotide adenylyltransferase